MRDKRTTYCGGKFEFFVFKIKSFTNSSTLVMISISDSQHTFQAMSSGCLETPKVDGVEDVTLPHLHYGHVDYAL